MGITREQFYAREMTALFASGLVQDEAGWRDISSAPKDGATIEVRDISDDPRRVRWSQSRHGSGWHLVSTSKAVRIMFDPTEWRPLNAASNGSGS